MYTNWCGWVTPALLGISENQTRDPIRKTIWNHLLSPHVELWDPCTHLLLQKLIAGNNGVRESQKRNPPEEPSVSLDCTLQWQAWYESTPSAASELFNANHVASVVSGLTAWHACRFSNFSTPWRGAALQKGIYDKENIYHCSFPPLIPSCELAFHTGCLIPGPVPAWQRKCTHDLFVLRKTCTPTR